MTQFMTHRRLLLFVFPLAAVFGLLQGVYRIHNDLTYGRKTNAAMHLFCELSSTFAAGFLFLLLLPLVRRFRIRRNNLARVIPSHLLILILYSLSHTALMWLIRAPLFPLFGWGRYDYGTWPERFVMEFAADILIYIGYVGVAHFVWLYQESREREAILVRAQLQALQARLEPHFLSNSLNAISNLVYEDPRRADEMIGRLSELLRRVLRTDAVVPLSEEIRTTELYLDMMQVRFEDRLSIEFEIDPEAEYVRVPNLLLQPLVENALHHGADPATRAVSVRIAAQRNNGSVRLEVSDRGAGGVAEGKGTGLENTRQRLEKLFGQQASFHAGNALGGGFRCEIEIPCER